MANKRKPVVAARSGPSTAMIIGIVVVVLFAAAVGFGVYRSQQAATGPVAVPPNATAEGVPVGRASAKATIDIYLDFQCPVCREYEQQSGATIDQLVASGQAKVVYHPIAILDRYSSTQYSSRASAASGCAAASGVFPQYVKLLYANQPPENGDGLSAAQLVSLGQQAGATGSGFATCVTDQTYKAWTASLTDQASKAGVNGTPTVKVNGQVVDNTDAALRAAVAAAQ
ncbi:MULTISPECIES: thioredoxin domain-containing protein [unclassified Pseudonocardia]|uniref:DsbA family protein n=1 Tax=unclassified Pseudonocardia TaxID=2619320 RepID=UPI001AC187C7|nr:MULTISPECIES: thioredoxin domain-containing protein [unclassified Pseudonocardia]MBN9096508.1 thioredoxin domain-containing protein [Pseudonocardia sp.]